ncbi:hypothetical protein PSHT_05202 [Puccinia striiformis]|uniref:Uncharacterized protein n=1 Tax=Puccinia striiformis TaxID=27350 RepID=A0A2S4WB15_9BASI|nr:hypothetical protein PSHT_05202 [Puccinia striiformis]
MVDAKTDTTVHPSSPPHPHPIIAESGRGKNGDEELVLAASSRTPFLPTVAFFRKPFFQVVIISMVCFCCPGMFNALSGLGGGGQINPKTADNANVALYSTFATTAFLSGSIVNKIGPRLSLSIGSVGYTLFIGSYLSYNINQNSAFVIAAGAILGVCAGLLWTAQGSLMLAYATEATKGRYIASFWIIFNLGAVLGEAVALGKNYRDTTVECFFEGSKYVREEMKELNKKSNLRENRIAPYSVSLLHHPLQSRRTDGSIVTIERNPGWKIELKSMFKTLTQDPTILLLFPFFWASNWFYTYQFNDYNLALFNIRTRSLNALLYWLSQIFGSGLFGLLLDFQRAFNRQQRACLGWIILTSVIFVVWGFGWMVQKDYERGSVTSKMDWSDSSWIMGMLADDPRDLAPLVGFYKGIQSAGAAVIFRIDSNEASYHAIFISSWSLLALGLFCLIPLLLFRIKNDLIRSPKLLIPPNHQLPPPSSTTTTTFKLEKQSVKK